MIRRAERTEALEVGTAALARQVKIAIADPQGVDRRDQNEITTQIITRRKPGHDAGTAAFYGTALCPVIPRPSA